MPPPYGGVRTFHQKSTCLAKWTLRSLCKCGHATRGYPREQNPRAPSSRVLRFRSNQCLPSFLMCTGARPNLATCGTNKGARKGRIALAKGRIALADPGRCALVTKRCVCVASLRVTNEVTFNSLIRCKQAHMRQPRTDPDIGFQVEALKRLLGCPLFAEKRRGSCMKRFLIQKFLVTKFTSGFFYITSKEHAV